jgi:hypothetical protein
VDVLASFFTLLYSIKLHRDGEDKLWWSPSRKGKFDVRSFYKTLAYKEIFFFYLFFLPWKSIWQTKAPLKVAFFTWTIALGKILTLDNLSKRQVIVINRCCMCKKYRESVDHLLLHYEFTCILWNAIFCPFSLSWVTPRRVVDLFASWWTDGRFQSAVVKLFLLEKGTHPFHIYIYIIGESFRGMHNIETSGVLKM